MCSLSVLYVSYVKILFHLFPYFFFQFRQNFFFLCLRQRLKRYDRRRSIATEKKYCMRRAANATNIFRKAKSVLHSIEFGKHCSHIDIRALEMNKILNDFTLSFVHSVRWKSSRKKRRRMKSILYNTWRLWGNRLTAIGL